MKPRAVSWVTVFVFASALSGCGMFDMPGKMDNMSALMSQTNAKLDQNTTDIHKTAEGIHLQKLAEAKKQMLDPDNTLVPDNPSKMIDAGKIFAEEATPEELAQIVELFTLEIDEDQPDDSVNVNGATPVDLKAKIEHDKIAELTALQVILGFAQQEKIEQMVQDQIVHQGRYKRAALAGLELRAVFIQGYRFGIALYEHGLNDLGELREAVDLGNDLEYIVRLPDDIAAQIGLKTSGMLVPADNVDLHLDVAMTVDYWNQVADRAQKQVAPNVQKEGDAEKIEFQHLVSKISDCQSYNQVHHHP